MRKSSLFLILLSAISTTASFQNARADRCIEEAFEQAVHDQQSSIQQTPESLLTEYQNTLSHRDLAERERRTRDVNEEIRTQCAGQPECAAIHIATETIVEDIAYSQGAPNLASGPRILEHTPYDPLAYANPATRSDEFSSIVNSIARNPRSGDQFRIEIGSNDVVVTFVRVDTSSPDRFIFQTTGTPPQTLILARSGFYNAKPRVLDPTLRQRIRQLEQQRPPTAEYHGVTSRGREFRLSEQETTDLPQEVTRRPMQGDQFTIANQAGSQTQTIAIVSTSADGSVRYSDPGSGQITLVSRQAFEGLNAVPTRATLQRRVGFKEVQLMAALRSQWEALHRANASAPGGVPINLHATYAQTVVAYLRQTGVEAEALLSPDKKSYRVNILPLANPGALRGRTWLTRMATTLRRQRNQTLAFDTAVLPTNANYGDAFFSPSERTLVLSWDNITAPTLSSIGGHEGVHMDFATNPRRLGQGRIQNSQGLGRLYDHTHNVDESTAYVYQVRRHSQTAQGELRRIVDSGATQRRSIPAATIQRAVSEANSAIIEGNAASNFLRVQLDIFDRAITIMENAQQNPGHNIELTVFMRNPTTEGWERTPYREVEDRLRHGYIISDSKTVELVLRNAADSQVPPENVSTTAVTARATPYDHTPPPVTSTTTAPPIIIVSPFRAFSNQISVGEIVTMRFQNGLPDYLKISALEPDGTVILNSFHTGRTLRFSETQLRERQARVVASTADLTNDMRIVLERARREQRQNDEYLRQAREVIAAARVLSQSQAQPRNPDTVQVPNAIQQRERLAPTTP